VGGLPPAVLLLIAWGLRWTLEARGLVGGGLGGNHRHAAMITQALRGRQLRHAPLRAALPWGLMAAPAPRWEAPAPPRRRSAPHPPPGRTLHRRRRRARTGAPRRTPPALAGPSTRRNRTSTGANSDRICLSPGRSGQSAFL